MIELHSDQLIFSFPDLHARLREQVRAWVDACVEGATSAEKGRLLSDRGELYETFVACIPRVRTAISFHRTFRIPDDGRDYPLPPGLGRFSLRHVDDFGGVPEDWKKRGGVMLPIHKTEAMWLRFYSDYPMALKVGAGGICAVSGERWATSLQSEPQNYLVLPDQPWLDGFRVSREVVRQFVAMPLGKGLTVEHQLTGEESWGGLQLQAFPNQADDYWTQSLRAKVSRRWHELVAPVRTAPITGPIVRESPLVRSHASGLGAGGRLKQEITADPFGIAAWDTSHTSRCFVHLCLADDWQRLTGTPPPQKPPTAADYTKAGLPWFDYDAGKPAVEGLTALSRVKPLGDIVGEEFGLKLHDNAPVTPTVVIKLKPSVRSPGVREF